MKNLAIVNATAITPFASAPLAAEGGECALDKSLSFARRLPHVEATVIFCREGQAAIKAKTSGPATVVAREDWSVRGLLTEMARVKAGYDHIFYYFADCPFLDEKLAGRMFAHHVQYFSDYTFADGYPYGLAVEIIKPSALEPLIALVKEDDVLDRETIFEVLKRDINAFDLETEISPVDVRQLRLTLAADTKRNYLLCRNVAAAGGRDEASLLDVVRKKPELLRTLPAFFNVQIVEGCPQVCSYCPYPAFRGDILGKKGEMATADLDLIVRRVKDFCGDATLSLSLWGDPALHGRVDEIIRQILAVEGMTLVVETSGVGWDREILRELAAGPARPLYWIVSLDAWTEEEYRPLRGEGFREAVDTARLLLSLYKNQVYIQAVRMNENEAALERFYREWKKETDRIIIQKYDHFSGFLPERKVADLSPLNRAPCWHLKRDLAVLLDGTVPLCREDVNVSRPLGNLLKESLEEIWRRGEAVYREHLAENYAVPCKACDEYYTYNF